MQIQNLKEGQTFKLPGKRTFHTIKHISELNGEGIPEQHRGKMLVVTDRCKQFVLDKELDIPESRILHPE